MLNQNNDLKKFLFANLNFIQKGICVHYNRRETIGSKVQQSAATEATSVAESRLHCSPTKSHWLPPGTTSVYKQQGRSPEMFYSKNHILNINSNSWTSEASFAAPGQYYFSTTSLSKFSSHFESDRLLKQNDVNN